jgi:hypothetical protein
VIKIGVKRLHVVFMPRHVHARVTIHSMATVTGAVVAVRMGWGGAPVWAALAWYFGGFVGFHIVLAPFMAAWFIAVDRIERWVRSIVEEELIRFDMKGYERQLQRVFPVLAIRSDDDEGAQNP